MSLLAPGVEQGFDDGASSMFATGRRKAIVHFSRGYVYLRLDSRGEIQFVVAKVYPYRSASGRMLNFVIEAV